MSKFDPDFYSRFRPFYPGELFAPLGAALERQGFSAPYEIVDVGCGTGHSVASLAAGGLSARMTGVDPDPAMLAKARALCPGALFSEGSGERTGLASGAFDAVTVGSAFHWMDAQRAREEFLRILKPRGLVFVYEYQFPKAQGFAELNEWIRREFNLRWKAPQQRPRGDFAAVTACFRTDARFLVLSDHKIQMIQKLGSHELTGLLLSQSRVLHYEAEMDVTARDEFRRWLAAQVDEKLGGRTDSFDFSLQAALWSKV